MLVEHTRYTVPDWGVGELWTSEGIVMAHDFSFATVAEVSDGAFAHRARPPKGAHGPPTGTVPSISPRMGHRSVPNLQHHGSGRTSVDPEELVGRFAAFLAGEGAWFDDVALDLSWTTSFQRAVADTLRAVPRGEVVSYGELAALVGHPRAQRAVGTFCARNRFMLLVPCHRVIGANGIGGYGSAGVAVKRRLLALEGVTL